MPLVAELAQMLVPELMTPGMKPTNWGLLKARKTVLSYPYLRIAQIVADPLHIHGNGAAWSNVARSHAGNILVPTSGDTLTATAGFDASGVDALYWLMKIRPKTIGNYYPVISNGIPWGGNATMHGESGGELYSGVSAVSRIDPADTAAPVLVANTWTRLSCGFGVHTDGVYFGARLAKDGTLLVHKAEGVFMNSSQGALSITGGIEIEYLVQVLDLESRINFVARDAEWLAVMNAIHADPYNELFELA